MKYPSLKDAKHCPTCGIRNCKYMKKNVRCEVRDRFLETLHKNREKKRLAMELSQIQEINN